MNPGPGGPRPVTQLVIIIIDRSELPCQRRPSPRVTAGPGTQPRHRAAVPVDPVRSEPEPESDSNGGET
eukprot:764783-Hanusia_phi.AAC.6